MPTVAAPAKKTSKKTSARKTNSAAVASSARRGRPKGSKNKAKDAVVPVEPTTAEATTTEQPKRRGRRPRDPKVATPKFEVILKAPEVTEEAPINVIDVPEMYGNEPNMLTMLKSAVRRGVLKESDLNILLSTQAPENTTISLSLRDALKTYTGGMSSLEFHKRSGDILNNLIRDGVFGKMFLELKQPARVSQQPRKERKPRQARGSETVRMAKMRKQASLMAREELKLPARGRINAELATKYNTLVEQNLHKLEKETAKAA